MLRNSFRISVLQNSCHYSNQNSPLIEQEKLVKEAETAAFSFGSKKIFVLKKNENSKNVTLKKFQSSKRLNEWLFHVWNSRKREGYQSRAVFLGLGEKANSSEP